MNVNIHMWYLYDLHRQSSTIWFALIRINTDGKSLIRKSNPGGLYLFLCYCIFLYYTHILAKP